MWKDLTGGASCQIYMKIWQVRSYSHFLYYFCHACLLRFTGAGGIVKILFLIQWQWKPYVNCHCTKNRIFTIPPAPVKRSKQAWQTCWFQSTQICRIQTKEKLLKKTGCQQMMRQWEFWRRVQKSPILLFVFLALKMIQCAWDLQGLFNTC